ncbi:MAG: hypothetical protein COY80_04105 [Candidatus Pacebacteria bacterium CG_4_10_14_0_8_um_filter_42_14]|nr:MAG: hypothetical protein COY80_04105 [Candidatus Pacebacteria bacterium CG_4_10_14_0_8_um_filter_42_14]
MINTSDSKEISSKEAESQIFPSIEPANGSHISTIAAIEKQSWLSAYPNQEHGITVEDVEKRFVDMPKREQLILADMNDSSHKFFVVHLNTQIIGYIHLLFEPELNDLVEIYLIPSEQGKGYGKRLIDFALREFGNSKPIQLEVATYNERAKALYAKYGFVEKPDLVQPPKEDWNVLPSGKRIPVVFMVKKGEKQHE